jgi:hypothetical protein
MNRSTKLALGLALAGLWVLPAWAQDAGQPPAATTEPRELIYCAELMTPAEREAYRARMRAAATPQERAAVRQAHRETMQARARERGVDVLQCEPQRRRLRLRGGVSP